MALVMLGAALAAFGVAGVVATGGTNAGFAFLAVIAAGALVALTGLFRRVARRSESNMVRRLYGAYKVIMLALLGIFAVTLAAGEIYILANSGAADDAAIAECDYAVVLGAGLNGSVPSDVYRSRLDAAAELLEKNPGMTAVLTGGRGEREDVSEARAAYTNLTARGIEPERLILEERASNTLENMKYSSALLGDYDGKVAVVTSDFHMARSLLCAGRNEIDAAAYPAETPWPLVKANFCFREYFGLVKLLLFSTE